MKAGEVFHMRLPPKDVVALYRVCERAGMVLPGASLAQHMVWGVRILAESARQSGSIPAVEDDFQAYSEIKQRFAMTPHGKKLDSFRVLSREEIAAEVADRPIDLSSGAAQVVIGTSPARARKERRLAELVAKAEADPLNFGEEESQEMEQLTEELRRG